MTFTLATALLSALTGCTDRQGELLGQSIESLVEIPAGSFTMGCTPEQEQDAPCGEDEYPTREITLTQPFLMSAYEVTQYEYFVLMSEWPAAFEDCDTRCPVESVSWHMAAEFANQASAQESLEACYRCSGRGEDVSCTSPEDPYTCEGYRLPTEAEWEFAARCGEGTIYAGSDDLDEVAWYYNNSGSRPREVGQLEPNACGLYDMTGNVWEWTEDGYDPAFYSTTSSPIDPWSDEGLRSRVLRGGDMESFSWNLRIARRESQAAGERSPSAGFRLVRSLLD